MNYSFTSEPNAVKYGLTISHRVANPMSIDDEAMRPSLIGGLMASFEHNRPHGHNSIKLFESGRVFTSMGEHTSLGVLAYGKIWPQWWKFESLKIPAIDYYYLAGIIKSLFIGNKLQLAAPGKNIPYLHPGKCADIALNGNVIGHVGAVHPGYYSGLNSEVVYCEMDVDKIKNAISAKTVMYLAIKRFPPVKRDLSLVADKALSFDKIAAFIEKSKHDSMVLDDVRLFSVFEGEKLAADKISYALHLTFRHSGHTLADPEVNAEVERFLNALQAELEIRSVHKTTINVS